MNIFLLICLFLSFTVWIIAPIRQIGQKYFMFFLILISGDVITIICRYTFHSRTNVFYIISDLLCLISIQGRKSSKLLIMLISVLSITTFIVEFWGLGYKGEFLLITFCNFLLFYKFFQQSIIKYTEEKILSIFLGCLSLYELISVTKLVGFITDAASATLYFEIATAIQILFGLFFCIFKESNSRLLIKLE